MKVNCRFLRIGLLALLGIVFWTSQGIGETTAQPIELKVASFLSESDHQNKVARKIFDQVEKKTNNKVKFTYFYSQSLVGAKDAFSGTVKGRCDIFNGIVPAYTPGRFPMTSLVDLAPNIPYAEDASIAFWKFYNQELKDEWKDLKVLAVYVQVPQHIHTRKGPVKNFADMEGKQFRVYGAGKDMVEVWGGIPVSIPMSEAYMALNKGVCDGIMGTFNQMNPNKLSEVTKYHTIIGCLSSPFIVGMNWKSYKALPPEVQKVLDEMGESASREYGASWDSDELENIEFLKKEGGHEFIILSEAELVKWREKAQSINDGWLEELESKGIPAKEVFEKRTEIWNEYVGKEKPWATYIKD